MNLSQTTRRIQCVCGNEFEYSGSSDAAECPKCGRTTFAISGQNSFALQQTVIGDVTEQHDDVLPVSEGDQLDHFTVLEQIGAGGMGAVFRARDESLQRFVALKVIRGRDHAETRRESLIHEARAQARVSHPNIVHIYYVGLHNNCPFFAMELVDGVPLSTIANNRRLPFSEIIEIGLQTTNALRHSARQGVIHGDVKPANILLEHGSHVKLSDFGLAGTHDNGGEGDSQTGPAGTLNYMAPEVAAGQPADERSDMYSLGVMLYELSFGELPTKTTSAGLKQQLEERQKPKLVFPEKWPQDRPEEWREFLEHILQTNPEKRPQTYERLDEELASWQPNATPPAGRLLRGFSFLVDQAIAGILAGFAGLLALLPQAFSDADVSTKGGPLLWLVLAVSIWIHVRFRKSPAKHLMHLKIVDMFGLKPAQWKLTIKSIGTYCFFWVSAIADQAEQVSMLFRGVGLDETSIYETALGVAAGVMFVVNLVWLVFSKKGQSAVDYFLNLQVVLDAPVARKNANQS